MKICSIHDVKSEAWMQPMFFQANGAAVRAFSDACRDVKSPIGMHPEDYHLYLIGEFDEESGQIVGFESNVHLLHGANVKETE